MVGQNWAHNISFNPWRVAAPTSVAEVTELISENATVGVVGAGHSFNDIADTDGVLIATNRMRRVLAIDSEAQTVTMQGGIRYHELCDILNANGFALHNLMSIPHFSVAGATATATHGSGDNNRCLASAIRAVEFVNGAGDLVSLERGHNDFGGVPIALGALGVITQLTLDIEPAFEMTQEVLLDLPTATAIESFDEIMASAYSVSLFTDWQGTSVNQLWRKHRNDSGTASAIPTSYLGARPSTGALLPSGDAGGRLVTPQLLINGPWHQRLPHIDPTHHLEPAGELQTEYFVTRTHARQALEVVASLGDKLAPALRLSEIRTVASDELWLSPFSEPTLALHFSWHIDADLGPVFPVLEEALSPFDPLPHWGKLHTMPAAVLRRRYPRFDDFRALAQRHDPNRKFRNAYLNDLLD